MKICRFKKHGWEREGSLSARWLTSKRFEKKLCKRSLNFPTVVKVFENKFGQVVEKSFESILCLFGFVKAAKFRDSREYSDCIQNVWAKSCLTCQILYIKQKIFAERGKA